MSEKPTTNGENATAAMIELSNLIAGTHPNIDPTAWKRLLGYAPANLVHERSAALWRAVNNA